MSGKKPKQSVSKGRTKKVSKLSWSVRLRRHLLSQTGLIIIVAALAGGSVTLIHTLAPGAAADVTPDHSRGILPVEPVILPYCAPGSDTCPSWENSFPYPYQLKIYQVMGTLETLVYSADKFGPKIESIKLLPGQYAVQFYAGTLKSQFPTPQTVTAGYINEPLKLHFYYPKDSSINHFLDYNHCVYFFTYTPQRGKYICPTT